MTIQSTSGSTHQYELLGNCCSKCAYPDCNQATCRWKHNHQDVPNRIYALGRYYKTSSNPDFKHKLSAHIMGTKRYRGYTTYLGIAMACGITDLYKELLKVDAIVPIPYYDGPDGSELGIDREDSTILYDQAEEICKIISERTGLSLIQPLQKTRMQSMHELENDQERFEAVDGLFVCVNPQMAKGKKLLLIDDIMTSGASFYGCATVLKKAGAKEILAFAAGRTVED